MIFGEAIRAGQQFERADALLREQLNRAIADELQFEAVRVEADLVEAIRLQNYWMLERLHVVVGVGQRPAVASTWENPWPENFAWARRR